MPFIAEYIASARVSMWEFPDPKTKAKKIGWLEKGEVVAVTQVWGKYRLWVQRLRWNCLPSSGWVPIRHPSFPFGQENADKCEDILIDRLKNPDDCAM